MRRDREWPGISAPSGAHVMDAWDKSVRLGALPLPLFINGHGYFVQSAHKRLGVSPLAVHGGHFHLGRRRRLTRGFGHVCQVHATYSLDNHDGVAKTQRFREAGLWDVDPPEYYAGRCVEISSRRSHLRDPVSEIPSRCS